MRTVEVRNLDRESCLGDRIAIADRFLTRLRGLLGRDGLEDGEGLIIAPSQGIHMFGMKFPLDVAMLDDDKKVVALYPDLQPGKRTKMHRDARYALELPVGVLNASLTEVGDLLGWNAQT